MDQQQQFSELYKQFGPGIRKLCLGYTADAAWAEDLLQETFISVWNNMHKFKGDAQWGTWIFRIAVNTCLMHLRKRNLNITSDESQALKHIADSPSNKEHEIQLLYKCIARLPEIDRLIISLVLEDRPYEEIADVTGITENNLRVKIHRIKKQLTEIYNLYERI